MADQSWQAIHSGLIERLLHVSRFSEDERRDLLRAVADANEQIQNPESYATDRAAARQAAKEAKRAELQRQLAEVDAE